MIARHGASPTTCPGRFASEGVAVGGRALSTLAGGEGVHEVEQVRVRDELLLVRGREPVRVEDDPSCSIDGNGGAAFLVPKVEVELA